MKEPTVLHNNLYMSDIINLRADLDTKISPDNIYSGEKSNSDTLAMKSEIKKDSFIGLHKVHFKDRQMDVLALQGLCSDKSKRRNSLNIDSCNETGKSNITRSSASQVRYKLWNFHVY